MNSEIVHKRVFSTATSVTLLLCLPLSALADPPDGYYDSVDATNSKTLRITLHAVIDDHTRYPYSPSNTDAWNILELTAQYRNAYANIPGAYKNES